MKSYRQYIRESTTPKKLGKNRQGMTIYQMGNLYLVVSYSSMAGETAVFKAKNAQGDVTDYSEIVSVKGSESDSEMLKMAAAAMKRT